MNILARDVAFDMTEQWGGQKHTNTDCYKVDDQVSRCFYESDGDVVRAHHGRFWLFQFRSPLGNLSSDMQPDLTQTDGVYCPVWSRM